MKKLIMLIVLSVSFSISACPPPDGINIECRETFMETIKLNNIKDIKKGKDYVFTINGYIDHPSNELLKIVCKTYIETLEGYCDIGSFTADKNGSLNIVVKKNLPKGRYKVKFFLKETESWGIIWKKEPVEFGIC